MTDRNSPECMRRQYETFWDMRMQRLRRYGISRAAHAQLCYQKRGLLDWLVQHGPFEGIPFLPVVPFPWWDFCSQLRWAFGARDVSEHVPLPHALWNRDDVPDGPYYAVDVRYRETLGKHSRQDAVRQIRDSGRYPLTMAETTSFALQTSPLTLREGQFVVCGTALAGGVRPGGELSDLWITAADPAKGFEIIALEPAASRPDMRVASCMARLDPESLRSGSGVRCSEHPSHRS